MKLCIPSSDDRGVDSPISAHFGRAPYYTLYDTTDGDVEVIANESNHMGGSLSPPGFVASTGADVVVCGKLCRKAVERFDSMDVDVYCGTEGSVHTGIDQWENEELEAAVPGGDGCGHHGGHDHDRHDHDHGGHGHDHSGHDH